MKQLLPNTPVCTVRADLPISECVALLRDRALGALVVVSDSSNEEIVGIFTERDLVKNIELIRRGAFWDTPVRTVMTSAVHMITVEELHLAPRLMAKHHIRHLPIVSRDEGKTRLVGVLSMRDVFRIVMEQLDFDISRAFAKAEKKLPKKKTFVGVFSTDPAILQVVDQASKLTPRCLVKSAVFPKGLSGLSEYFETFSALFVDIDGMNPAELTKILLESRSVEKSKLFVAFNPSLLQAGARDRLHKMADHGHISLLSKPIALGLLYEKFLKYLR